MQTTDRIRRVKQFLDALHEQISSHSLEGNTVGIEFTISSAKGDVSASEALSFVSALKQAVSKFDEDQVVQFGLEFEIISPDQKSIAKGVQSTMKALIDLETNAEAAKKKIIA